MDRRLWGRGEGTHSVSLGLTSPREKGEGPGEKRVPSGVQIRRVLNEVGPRTFWMRAGDANWFQQFMGGEGTDIGRVTNQPVYDFIEKNQSNPFFIWYAPQLPHYPFDAPNKYRELYDNKGYSKSAVEYYANCTWFDDSVGELISHLKNKNLFDNTLFIYVNDNGWEQEPYQEFINDPMRSHNGGDKGKLSIFDQSFRTPIIFSWKNKIKSNIQETTVPPIIFSTITEPEILTIISKCSPFIFDFFG